MKINKFMIFPCKNLTQVLQIFNYVIIFHILNLFLLVLYSLAHCPLFAEVSVLFTRLPLETGDDDRAIGIKLGLGFYFLNFLIYLFFVFILFWNIHKV